MGKESNYQPESVQGSPIHEIIAPRSLAIVGVNTRWGNLHYVDEIHNDLVEKTGKPDLPHPGFLTKYHTSPDLTQEQASALEWTAVTGNLATLLNQIDQKSFPVGGFLVGCGSPQGDKYGDAIAKKLHLPENPREFYEACNSGGRALQLAIFDPEYGGQRVVVAGIEGMTRLLNPGYLNRADAFSLQTFGNGMGSLSFVQGRDIRGIASVFVSGRDDHGYLSADTPYPYDHAGQLIQTDGRIEKIGMPIPPEGMDINIVGRGAAIMFIRAGVSAVDKLMTGYQQNIREDKLEDKPIAWVICHHPGYPTFTSVREHIGKEWGISREKIPWTVTAGNSSGSTTLMALNNWLPHINPGDRIMVVSYGAGWSASAMIVDFL